MDVKLVLPLLFRKVLTQEHRVGRKKKKQTCVSVVCIYEFLKNKKKNPNNQNCVPVSHDIRFARIYRKQDKATAYAHYCDDFLELDKHSNTKYLKLFPELIKSGAMCMLAGWSAGAASGEGRVPPAFPLIEGMNSSFFFLQSCQFSQNLQKPFLSLRLLHLL